MKKRIISLILVAVLFITCMPNIVFAADYRIITDGETDAGDEIISVSAGYGMAAAVRADGSVWTWGNEVTSSRTTKYREIALGQAAGTTLLGTPQMVISGDAKLAVCSLSAGCSLDTGSGQGGGQWSIGNTGVIDSDNSLWGWGGYTYAERTNYNYVTFGTTVSKPVKLLEDVVCYDSSGLNQAAVTSNGDLYTWGRNLYGQLGNGESGSTGTDTPVKVMSDVDSVAVGTEFMVIKKLDGSVWTCGRNNYGQLGIGTADDVVHSIPVKILDGIKQVTAGDDSAAALTTSGAVYVWGYGTYGELGLGRTGDEYCEYSPCINENLSNIDYIDFGYNHAGALDKNGRLWMWGGNVHGCVGNKTSSITYAPEIILRNVKTFSAGYDFTLAVCNDNTLWAWGDNTSYQLGDHTYERKLSPTQIYLGRVDVDFYVDSPADTKRKLSLVWDDTDLYHSPSVYNNDLAIAAAAMSNGYEETLSQMGFKYLTCCSTYGISKPGYAIYYKATYDFGSPHVEIVMAIRGTSNTLDKITDLKSVRDGFSSAGDYCFNQLKNGKTDITSALSRLGIPVNSSNTKYFITGHSLGAACANIVTLRLADSGLAQINKLFAYTFASPNYLIEYGEQDSVPGLFNIINTEDVVPKVPPGSMWGLLGFGKYTSHAGTNYYFSSKTTNTKFWESMYNLYGCYKDLSLDVIGRHLMPVYLSALMEDESTTSRAKIYSRLISVHCPVDVEVYSADGELVAHSEGETVTYDSPYTPVTIYVDGDEKYIDIADESKYIIRYVGTDDGTMKIEDQVIDLDENKVISEEVFKNMTLEAGKIFESPVDASEEEVTTEMFVLDSEGDRISEVDTLGLEKTMASIDIADYSIVLDKEEFQYDGTEKMPEVTVEGLTEGKDYRVIYLDCVNIGTASVIVKGINDYFGRVTKEYTIKSNGTCGEGVSWKMDSSMCLYISGEGIISGDSEGNMPWASFAGKIEKLTIRKGVTEIGDGSFQTCTSLKDVVLPESVTSIGQYAFSNCNNLSDVYYNGTDDQWAAINIASDNEQLVNADIHYNEKDPSEVHTLEAVLASDVTCIEPGNTAYWFCTDCGKYFADAEGETEIEEGSWIIPAAGHSFTNYISDGNATCSEDGTKTAKCDHCSEIRTIPDEGSRLGHDLKATAAKAATCTTAGNSEYWYCKTCKKYFSDAAGTTEIAKESWVINKLGHLMEHHSAVAATYKATGNTEYWYCKTCKKYFSDAAGTTKIAKDSWVIPKLVAVTSVKLDTHTASMATSKTKTKDTGDVDTPYTITSASTLQLTATVSPVDATDKTLIWSSSDESIASVDENGLVTAYKFSKKPVTITVKTAVGDFTDTCTIQTRYWDVAGNNQRGTEGYQYWFDPVYWAADKGITAGYQQVYFGAELNCTRGSLAVFLWRLAGKPSVSSVKNPFNDVKESELGKTYYNAILWAYSKEITKGYSDGGFHPNDQIIRKDIMIMIYRYAGKPTPVNTKGKAEMTFTDVVGMYKTNTDTYKAIQWAYYNGITGGYTSGPYTGQFGCSLNCLRKDIVTFLYRYNNLKK